MYHFLERNVAAGMTLTHTACKSAMLKRAYGETLWAKPDYAMLSVVFSCGLRAVRLVGLEMDHNSQCARALGRGGSNREGWAYSNCSGAWMDQGGARFAGHRKAG